MAGEEIVELDRLGYAGRKNTHVRAERYDYGNAVGLYVYVRGEPGEPHDYVPEPLRMRPVQLNQFEHKEALLSMGREAGQQLFDDLWHCGFRPSDMKGVVGTAETIHAMNRHLSDLQRLVFDHLVAGAKHGG